MTACLPCPADSFSGSQSGAEECEACSFGKFSPSSSATENACSCALGTFESSPDVCAQCAVGLWDHDSASSTPCQHCRAGFGGTFLASCPLQDGSQGVLTPDDDFECNPCDTSVWPDVVSSCGGCRVVVDPMASVNSLGTSYQGRCDIYCESIGRTCAGAYDAGSTFIVGDQASLFAGTCDIDEETTINGAGNGVSRVFYLSPAFLFCYF